MSHSTDLRSTALKLLSELSVLCRRPRFSKELLDNDENSEINAAVAEAARTFLRVSLRSHPTYDDREQILEAAGALARCLDAEMTKGERSSEIKPPAANLMEAYKAMWAAMWSRGETALERERRAPMLTRLLRLVPFDYKHCSFPTTYIAEVDCEEDHPALAMRRMWDFLVWRESEAQVNLVELHSMMVEHSTHRSASKLADRVTGRYGRSFIDGVNSLEESVEREIGRRLLPDERMFVERFIPYTDVTSIFS